jgi:hypothetical protein
VIIKGELIYCNLLDTNGVENQKEAEKKFITVLSSGRSKEYLSLLPSIEKGLEKVNSSQQNPNLKSNVDVSSLNLIIELNANILQFGFYSGENRSFSLNENFICLLNIQNKIQTLLTQITSSDSSLTEEGRRTKTKIYYKKELIFPTKFS